MPRNGSDIYSIPPGTEGFPDTTIESAKYNTYIHDVETDLNTPRPISVGGTGANDADEALANLGGEKSSQRVTNYDTHIFKPGSFYSDIAATASPVAGHAFVGWIVSSDAPVDPPANQNLVVHARDQSTDKPVPGRLYVREKKSGVWVNGGQWSIDGSGILSDTPPLSPPDGALWWDPETGQLYVYYRDIDSAQWVIASPVPDPAQFLLKAGDTMEGVLGLASHPVNPLDAASKDYVDNAISTTPPFPTGTVMLFKQTAAPTGWTKLTTVNDAGLRVVSGTPSDMTTGAAWSAVFGQTATGNHTLTAAEQANMSFSGSLFGTSVDNQRNGAMVRDDATGNQGYTTGAPGGILVGITTLTVSGSASGSTTNGGGQPHSHPLALNLNYVDVILASRD